MRQALPPADGGFGFVADEDYVVAFAKPAVGVLQNAKGVAHQVAAAPGFGEDVVVPAVEVDGMAK